MKFIDLLGISVGNLLRRRVRTALTVLGVLIGTASVVTMVSLGIGLNELTMQFMMDAVSIKTVTVYPTGLYDEASQVEPNYIKDETIELFRSLAHVEAASPVLMHQVLIRQGSWELNTDVYGVNGDFMKNIPVAEGNLPKPDSGEFEFVIGNHVIMSFINQKQHRNYYYGEDHDIDYFNKPLYVTVDMDAYYASRDQSAETPVQAPKKYLFKTAAVVDGDMEHWTPYSSSIYVNIDMLKGLLKKVYGRKAIPGQPTTKNGKPLRFFSYDEARVYVDEVKNVTSVQKMIQDMGYEAMSDIEWIESSNKQSNLIQAVLGGIGAVSLFVAAIGIANTMMMSIYERTKEIGIMKVLGCDMLKIRDMFLIESGFIGLCGGLAGLVLSYIISFIVNKFGGAQAFLGIEGNISVIPLWLALLALLFAILIGMIAGFLPAMRAMKLSPLAALRNE